MASNILYLSVNRQMNLENQMAQLTYDLASSTAPGYKPRKTIVTTQREKSEFGRYLEFSKNAGEIKDPRQGQFQPTGNPLHVAIMGQGHFSIQTEKGTAYTRDGTFTKDLEGHLITTSGHYVLSDGGGQISLSPQGGGVKIMGDGTVLQGTKVVGRIGVVQFGNDTNFDEMGDNLYTTSQEARPADHYTLESGGYELSTVEPVEVSIQLLEILRQYERLENQNKTLFQHDRTATESLITSPRSL